MRLLYLLSLLLLSNSLLAQSSITGAIVDYDTNKSIPFASVSLLQKDSIIKSITTDIEGRFTFDKLEAGVYALQVIYVGYSNQLVSNIKLGLGDNVSQTIVMSTEGQLMEEIVVTSYRVPLIQQDNTTQAAVTNSKRWRGRKRSKRKMKAAAIQNAVQVVRETPVYSREQYNEIKENTFIETATQSISTLSTDVDRASYANIRGLINAGQTVPKDAVRIEEMINYFPYREANPKDGEAVSAVTELSDCPWNSEHQLLRVAVQAKRMYPEKAPASNIVFLVDVSGSMSAENKLPLVTKGLGMLASNLRAHDKVAIVTYAGAAGIALESTSGADKITILNALTQLSAGGSTAGGEGIALAYKVASNNFIKGGNNRIVLVTDGDFNIGISDQAELVELIEKKRESGIFLTVIGCGRGNYQEGKMQELANHGNGNHGYLDNFSEARKLLIDEFGGTVYTVAKDVKLQLAFNEKAVKSYRLIGYENRLLNTADFDDDTKDAAELGAGHHVTVLYEIERTKATDLPIGTLRLRYKAPDQEVSKKLSWVVNNDLVSFNRSSDNLRWAAAVAEFGLVLRDSPYKGNATLTSCRKHAKAAIGHDVFGYRKEMISLINKVSRKQ